MNEIIGTQYFPDSLRSSEGSMGQVGGRPDPTVQLAADSPDPPERLEPEGTEGESSPGFSLLSVDKRVFGRLQVRNWMSSNKLHFQ